MKMFHLNRGHGMMQQTQTQNKAANKATEDENQSNVTMAGMFKFVFGTVLKRPWVLVLNVVVLTILSLMDFLLPQFNQYIIDHVIPNKSVSQLIVVVGLLLLTVTISGIFTYLSTYWMGVMSQGAITNLRNQLYRYLIRLDTHFFESSKTGDLMVQLTSDINNLQNLISPNMLSLIGSLFTFVGVLVFVYFVNWEMALAVSLTFPFIFLVVRIFRTRIRESYRKARQSQALMTNQLQNTLTEIQLIKSYTTEDLETNRFDKLANMNKDNIIEATRNQAIFSPLINFIEYLGTAIVLLLGTIFVFKKQLTLGELVAYLSYVGILQSPISSFSRLLNQFQQSLVSYGRIMDIMALKPQILDAPSAVDFPKIKTGVVFDHVTFTYDVDDPETSHKPAIRDVSFDIPFGEQTALVGHSGAGKSTITELLDRLYDIDNGQITFDGVSIKDIKLRSLRQNIAIVSQDIFIIDGTIADNIKYGTPGATQDQLWEVAKLADIDAFIKGLPDQMKTQVGERGIKLSGGQKQRIAIARALLKDAQIVVLDEATASLDNESEKTIQHALENLMEQRTSLVIAHRLSTIHNADQILVVDDGEIVERGNHTSLMAQDGYYKQLYEAQFE
ncbi:ABC transporter ATP-binding protein [Lentilactobacillus hilgardii]|uniref:ABC transporter, ATP-binding protein n=1 Tax=Lentilactobacillus hilgardii (strain ATCC 8290 / DSM 20176 / CCUG 30140 / JCM 1155 / KCTC 3500 / NBRC 15886 / NCIMB 8040 / NRRL B-1843 / 9) TaxID=1423757 RepID=C0XJ73_LENH9|nr:ABC transporter ATP-binding protein [Lentilactobacillus hilgardii]EEI24652.1 ABC transporter, ATP-binding protein [Lentilactobacillus hilgardii DSM 20176 = ATCC 8290]KRK57280.1 ABC superfamily ATP binding cassette transporter, membrane protein [Lentilactobacillus hilgardii DSM 20176 = ATCC 8290]QEU37656.1 ABC transporter ATP-binding protein [Lentilactobacillus hilgardii]